MQVPKKIFHDKFCNGIRVMFNWERFFNEDWPIERLSLTDRQAFLGLKLPWYRGTDGFVTFDTPNALPVCLAEIEEWYTLLSDKIRITIENMIQEFLYRSQKLEFDFPAYSLSKSEYLVMDGNHRLSAIALTDLSFMINMWVVKGPIDENVLKDLTYLTREQQ
jgi:hypothetical protein